jgi:hypothetical protein
MSESAPPTLSHYGEPLSQNNLVDFKNGNSGYYDVSIRDINDGTANLLMDERKVRMFAVRLNPVVDTTAPTIKTDAQAQRTGSDYVPMDILGAISVNEYRSDPNKYNTYVAVTVNGDKDIIAYYYPRPRPIGPPPTKEEGGGGGRKRKTRRRARKPIRLTRVPTLRFRNLYCLQRSESSKSYRCASRFLRKATRSSRK